MLDDDYQNDIFQENVLVSYKFQLIVFTYFFRNSANLLNNIPSHVSNREVFQIFGNCVYNWWCQYDKLDALKKKIKLIKSISTIVTLVAIVVKHWLKKVD